MIAHSFRPVGHVTELIRKLENWKQRRTSRNVELKNAGARSGQLLKTKELEVAIAYLEEYRLLLRRLREIQKLWNNGRIDLLAGE